MESVQCGIREWILFAKRADAQHRHFGETSGEPIVFEIAGDNERRNLVSVAKWRIFNVVLWWTDSADTPESNGYLKTRHTPKRLRLQTKAGVAAMGEAAHVPPKGEFQFPAQPLNPAEDTSVIHGECIWGINSTFLRRQHVRFIETQIGGSLTLRHPAIPRQLRTRRERNPSLRSGSAPRTTTPCHCKRDHEKHSTKKNEHNHSKVGRDRMYRHLKHENWRQVAGNRARDPSTVPVMRPPSFLQHHPTPKHDEVLTEVLGGFTYHTTLKCPFDQDYFQFYTEGWKNITAIAR